MSKLRKQVGKCKTLVFLDFEGTQISHEMIAIGAVKCTLNAQGKIKKYYKPFKRLVKAKNRIGKVVERLCGINEEMLKKDGIEFFDAMEELKKYCGISFKNAKFVTFGSHDIRIINQSMQYTFHCPKEICQHIIHNHIDFLVHISEFIKEKDNNPYSLVNYCKLFGVEQAQPAHDPACDAINLAKLYDAFLSDTPLVFEEYKKTLARLNHVPVPVIKILTKLANDEDVTTKEYEQILKDYIDD